MVMRQVFQNMRNGNTSVIETPRPTPQAGEVLVKTVASVVSAGTERMLVDFAGKSLLGKARSRPDLVRQMLDKARREGLLTTIEAAFNRLDQPIPLGYSSSGVVVGLGSGVEGIRPGQRVACAGGGYAVHAEYEAVPVNLITPLPDSVDFEAAAFTTLGAIAMHGFRLAETQLGERVAVIGLGLVGLLAVQIATAAGCAVFGVDVDPQRVALAKELGVQAVLRSEAEEAALSFSRGRGCDAVLICADTQSSDPVELAGIIARDRARVIATGAVGLELPRKVYYEKELTFINSRSYGPGRYDPQYEEEGRDYPIGFVRWTEGRNLEAFVELLANEQVNVHILISHRFPIQQASQAYQLITGKNREAFLGVLLTYDQSAANVAVVQTLDRKGTEIVPFTLKPLASVKPNTCKLGVLGAGNFATTVLLPALKGIPEVELIGVTSASGASARHAADRFGFHYAASNEQQILDDPQINTIAVLTRHNLHARQTMAALAAGKHVFCEKPLALNYQELDELSELLAQAEEGSKEPAVIYPLLMVGFNRRFAPMACRLSDFLSGRSEPLFAHYRVNAGFLPLQHWLHNPQQGGGRIIGEGCHFVDFLTYLVGQPPVAVDAHGLPDHGRYHEDNVLLTFTFPDGSLGQVSYLANGDKAFPKERVEVFCGERVAVLDDFRSLELVSRGKRSETRSYLRQDKGHRLEWQAFSRAIIQDGLPPIPYTHLKGVTRAMLAAVDALREGRQISIALR